MSLGRPGTLDDDPALRQAVQAVYKLGIAIVVSAGNDSSKEDQENVTKSCFAQSVGILSTKLGGTTWMSGTRMAAPHVAGVVALMWQKALNGTGTPSPEEARSTMTLTLRVMKRKF